MKLSPIVPAFNEERLLPATLRRGRSMMILHRHPRDKAACFPWYDGRR